MKICGVAVIAAILLIIQRNIDSKNAFIIPVAAAIICFVCAISSLKGPIEYIKTLSTGSESVTSAVLKICGISFISEVSCLVCKEASETLVRCVNLASGVAIVLTVMPIFKSLVSYAVGLLP